MKFEVFNKREEREGMLRKKTVYCARTRIELTDEEFEALASMAKSKEWKLYPLGEYPLTTTQSIDAYLETFYSWTKKQKGVLEHGIRASTPEHRNLMISERKEIAITVKNVIAARLDAMQSTDDDESEEL